MCMFGSPSKPPPPTEPTEYAQAKAPSAAVTKAAGVRAKDRQIANQRTILTDQTKYEDADKTTGFTLLGGN